MSSSRMDILLLFTADFLLIAAWREAGDDEQEVDKEEDPDSDTASRLTSTRKRETS